MFKALNLKELVGAFNQEKALVGAFSVIVKTDCESVDRFTALVLALEPPPAEPGSWCEVQRAAAPGNKLDPDEGLQLKHP